MTCEQNPNFRFAGGFENPNYVVRNLWSDAYFLNDDEG